MKWHGYFGIENIGMNNTQRGLLVDALKLLGDNDNPQPAKRNHRRVRLDGDAVIFEAEFNTDNLTADKFKERLGNIFSIDPNTIDHDVNSNTITFSRNNNDYLRMVVFAGIGSTWEESGNACRQYLALNSDEWEDIDGNSI